MSGFKINEPSIGPAMVFVFFGPAIVISSELSRNSLHSILCKDLGFCVLFVFGMIGAVGVLISDILEKHILFSNGLFLFPNSW